MITSRPIVEYTVVEFGELKDGAELSLALGQANQVQQGFRFDWGEAINIDLERCRLPNGGYDLDAAAKETLQLKNLRKPVILLTSLPYGDRAHAGEEDFFFFSEHWADQGVAIISTHLWKQLATGRGMQVYLLMMLATEVFSNHTGLEFHYEIRGCLFDYCDHPSDAIKCLDSGTLCDNCETYLQTKIRKGELQLEYVAAAKRIFQRAVGKKCCFVVMPFARSLKQVYDAIAKELTEEGWIVVRADERFRARRIAESIREAIMTSDLVVADLTDNNPNVYFELGLSYVLGRDLILITQEKKVPIDIATEQRIKYSLSERGLRELSQKLRLMSGSGLF